MKGKLQARWRVCLRKICRFSLYLPLFLIVASTFARPEQAISKEVITIVIDSSFERTADDFLRKLTKILDADAREAIQILPRVVSASEAGSSLSGSDWALAIIDTRSLKIASGGRFVPSFDIPFVFSDLASVLDFQRSYLGREGLGTIQNQGITGLVYLNSGLTHIAGRKAFDTPADLNGAKIATTKQNESQILESLGGTPVAMSSGDFSEALAKGSVDSALMLSGIPIPGRFRRKAISCKIVFNPTLLSSSPMMQSGKKYHSSTGL